MATIQLKRTRIPSDVGVGFYLKDNGVAVAWTSLEDIRVHAFSVPQNAFAGVCQATPDTSDATRLNVLYPATNPQYPGTAKLVVVAKYRGRVKSFDVPVIFFVKTTEEVTGYQVIDDPEVDVAIQVVDAEDPSVVLEVADVSTSLLDQAIQDAEDAADAANAAAQDADAAAAAALAAKEDADTAAAGANTAKQNANSAAGRANSSATNANNAAAKANAAAEHGPKIVTGTWWVWDATNEEYVDTGIAATGPQGPQGNPGQQGEPGEPGPQGEPGAPGADGADGADGEDGADGITPHIDATTGHWFLGNVDTGVSAQGPQGIQGPAGVTSATIQVSPSTGTPSAQVSVQNGVLALEFSGLKGETGGTGPEGPRGPQGLQGNPGSSQDYPFELVNNEVTDDPDKAHTAAGAKRLKDEISQLAQEMGEDITLVETAPTQTVTAGKSVKGSDGTLTNSSLYDVVTISVSGAKRVRFLGVRTTTTATSGYAFYDSGGTCIKSEAWRSGASELSPEEYILDVPLGAATFKAGRRNEYSSASYYYVQTGDSVTDLLADKIGKKLGANLWDGTIAVTGRYLNSTGGTNANSSYSYTDFIEVEAETDYHLSAKDNANVANSSSMYLRYYNASFEDIGGKSSYNTDFTTPQNCKYVRFTVMNTKAEVMFQKGTARTYYEPYAPIGGYYVNLQEKQVHYANLGDDVRGLWSQHFESLRGGGTLAAGESLTLATNYCKADVLMVAHIEGTVETIKIGIGNTGLSNYLCYVIELTQTTLKMTRADTGTVTFNVSHGLTLTTHTTVYIDTAIMSPDDIAQDNIIKVNVTLANNLGATFTQNCNNYWGYGTPFIINANTSAAVDASLSFVPKDITKNVWLFGDSYLEFTYLQKRLPYWLWLNNYHGFMLCAKGGTTQADHLTVFESLLGLGYKPSIAIWMVGINDGVDTNSETVNSTAKSNLNKFVALCEVNHITPILQTTPTVPSRQHTALASYVRSLGVRYIDVAKAVGCDSSGNWYTGLLGEDEVHPTAAGSKVIFQQILLDCPEIATN